MGPIRTTWRGHDVVVDIGYRGPLWTPALGSPEWSKYGGEDWGRVREILETSVRQVRGVLFVADSQQGRADANAERLALFEANLRYVGRKPEDVAMVFALNKRDLARSPGSSEDPSRVLAVAELREQLAWPVCDYVETVARTGAGVDEAFGRLRGVGAGLSW